LVWLLLLMEGPTPTQTHPEINLLSLKKTIIYPFALGRIPLSYCLGSATVSLQQPDSAFPHSLHISLFTFAPVPAGTTSPPLTSHQRSPHSRTLPIACPAHQTNQQSSVCVCVCVQQTATDPCQQQSVCSRQPANSSYQHHTCGRHPATRCAMPAGGTAAPAWAGGHTLWPWRGPGGPT
jgi:hypothetical protein